MKDIYRFLAVFKKYDDGGYEVNFPDIPNCFTCGDNLDHSIYMAKDVLGLMLFDMEEEKQTIPEPSEPLQIKVNPNEFLMAIEVYMPLVRNAINNKAEKKTLTIPHWLNKLAMDNKINFSQVLQTALKKELNLE